MNYVILALLIGVEIFDIYLSLKDQPTISQEYQKLLPTWQDIIVLAMALTSLCFLEAVHPALRIWIAGILGHVFWPNKERYKD